ncbi:MAG: 23S rRNA (pseudouridine(1915)-N(3))-methyltransferase RlmH [Asticcacaulis sp.]
MRIQLATIGRLGPSPETELTRDYVRRATLSGRPLGLGPVEILEVDPRKSGKAPEAEALREALGDGVCVIACDERGKTFTSRAFASQIEKLRDQGERRLAFVIGGADGLDPAFVAEARLTLAFGPQTWPHALARVMLAEQVYRAITILGGSPYHRD